MYDDRFFNVKLEALEATESRIVVMVIENFLCNGVGETEDIKIINRRVTGAVFKFFEVVKMNATRLPTTKFALVEPMSRPALK